MGVRWVAIALFPSLLVPLAACKETTNGDTGPGTGASAGTGTTAPRPAVAVNADGLAIQLSFVTGENSKDSNSQSYSLSVTGESVSYAGPHPPCQRGRCAHGEVELALEKTLYDKAVAAITKGDLTGSFSEEKETGELGNYLKVNATVTLGGDTGTTKVVGMSYVLDGAAVLTDEAKARAEAVRMLLLPFRRAGEERLPSE